MKRTRSSNSHLADVAVDVSAGAIAAPDVDASASFADGIPRWVYLVPFDDHEHPLLIDTRLFANVSCRTAKVFLYQQPDCVLKHRPAWFSATPRAVLKAFVSALVHHEFALPKDVTYYEMLKHFEYEGISVPNGSIVASSSGAPRLGAPPPCLAGRRDELVLDHASRVAPMVAAALVEWRRLYFGFVVASTDGSDPDLAISGTRAWIRMLTLRPLLEKLQRKSASAELLTFMKRPAPRWLLKTLLALGTRHYELVWSEHDQAEHANGKGDTPSPRELPDALWPKYVRKAESKKEEGYWKELVKKGWLVPVKNDPEAGYIIVAREEREVRSGGGGGGASADRDARSLWMDRYSATDAAFTKLADACGCADHLGHFFPVRSDAARAHREADGGGMRGASKHASKFVKAVLSKVICDENPTERGGKASDELTTYARACVGLAIKIARETPDVGRIFSTLCASPSDLSAAKRATATPARKALTKALAGHRIRVVDWDDAGGGGSTTAKGALAFPPNLYDPMLYDGPAVLIELVDS